MGPPGSHAVRMCAARFNGCSEEAAGPAAASRMLDWTEAGPRILHSLEMGTVMMLFYQKKSQRPERRTFHIRPDMRLLVWGRNPDKTEGDSEYRQNPLSWRVFSARRSTSWWMRLVKDLYYSKLRNMLLFEGLGGGFHPELHILNR